MMTDEAQPPSSSSSDINIPPPEPDPPPNVIARMSSPSPSQASQSQTLHSGAHSTGTSEDKQSSSPNSSSTSPWLRWSRGLVSLLEDQQGRDLFETYLVQEGCSLQLHFLWACDGLAALDDPPKIPQLVRSIHRHFFQNAVLHGISDTTRSDLAQAIIDGRFAELNLYNKAKEEVYIHMQDNLYPNFLKSEIYLRAVNGEDEASSNLQEQLEQLQLADPTSSSPPGRKSSVGDASSTGGDEHKGSLATPLVIDVEQKSGGQSPKIPSPPLSTAPNVLLPNQLQTVHEDSELSVVQQSGHQRNANKMKLRLTKEALHYTDMKRASVPGAPPVVSSSKIWSGEGFSSHIHQKISSPTTTAPIHPYHAAYSSYNPVSRVDSEIQSMSSDAMTDDGAHSGHGHSSARKQGAHHHASRNKGHHQLSSAGSSHPPLHQAAHSSGDSRRQILRSSVLVDNRDNLPKYPPGVVGPRYPSREMQDPNVFAATLMRKLEEVKKERELAENFHQKISECGDHVPHSHPVGAGGGAMGGGGEEIRPTNVLALAINRLQVQDDGLPDDILDQHVSRVFRDITPDNRSPKLRSPTTGRRRGVPGTAPIRPRRERDLLSTFSGDSGNVHDYSCDTLPSTMPKSRSIPSEMRMQQDRDFTISNMIGASQRGRFSRGGGGGLGLGESRNVPLALTTKRTSSEFLDSGISVLSGATPTVISATQPAPTLPCDRTDLRVNQWVQQIPQTASMTSPPMMRRPKKAVPLPHMPAPMPATPTLEEVRRRLTKKPSPLPTAVLASQSIQIPVGPLSSGSTSGNPMRHPSPPSSDESSSATNKEHSISSFVFYEETAGVPYCIKIPCKTPSPRSDNGSPSTCGITLAVFKDHLPKRGNYRYFFTRECAEVCTKVVQEEITDDFQELPLFEGKIIARLQAAVGTPSTSTTMSILSEKM